MAEEKLLEELNQRIKADKTYSQIFIHIAHSSKLLVEAKKTVEALGVRIIQVKHLTPNWTLLKLGTKDMRDVALKLTEQGFLIKGINAIP
jgi:hypothetical protein